MKKSPTMKTINAIVDNTMDAILICCAYRPLAKNSDNQESNRNVYPIMLSVLILFNFSSQDRIRTCITPVFLC